MRATLLLLLTAAPAAAQVTGDVPARRPAAVVDLRTDAGVRLVRGRWKYADARVVDVAHRAVGADLKPSGPPNMTRDVEPHAGVAGFDDSGWETIPATSLEARRTNGRLAFGWYRIAVTVPERIAAFDPTGSVAVLEIVVDDYAEVWVDGKLPATLGARGGALVGGWNTPNRVILGRDVRPGQTFQIAVFGMNAPISAPPVNYVWIRNATLDFYRPEQIGNVVKAELTVTRKSPALDRLLPAEPRLERLASGFTFVEGPVWTRDSALLFSDPNDNMIYRWAMDGSVSVYRTKSGYSGFDIGEYRQAGSNGLALDPEGRLIIAEHGNRRISRLETNGVLTVLADRHQGKRLNSPNDVVTRSDGTIWFTDPPFGLPKFHGDPRRESPYTGVYRLAPDGALSLVASELAGPNGIAFSPDERYLYVSNWDPARKVIMRYTVMPHGSVADGKVFFDITATVPGELAWDGVKVDRMGNVYAAGPEGIYVLSPEGEHLGTLGLPDHVANMAWGDPDRSALYITATAGLYRLRLAVTGAVAVASR